MHLPVWAQVLLVAYLVGALIIGLVAMAADFRPVTRALIVVAWPLTAVAILVNLAFGAT